MKVYFFEVKREFTILGRVFTEADSIFYVSAPYLENKQGEPPVYYCQVFTRNGESIGSIEISMLPLDCMTQYRGIDGTAGEDFLEPYRGAISETVNFYLSRLK